MGRGEWGGLMWFRVGVWFIRGMLWWITSIVFLAWCILGTFSFKFILMEGFLRPECIGATYKTPYFGQNEPIQVYLPPIIDKFLSSRLPKSWILRIPHSIASISPFIVMWDYKWFQIQQIPGSQVEGLREYRELQFIVLITRFSAWIILKYIIVDAIIIMWTSAFLGIISFIVWSLFLYYFNRD
jgi:hypothetical protein